MSLPKFRKLQNLKCTHWSDTACTILLWKGEPLADISKENEIEVTVAISNCGEDMNLVTTYLKEKSENVIIKHMTIISRCPESLPQTQELSSYNIAAPNILKWLTASLESATLNSLPEHYKKENHVILFLRPSSLASGQRRTMDQVVQSAIENRFGCFLQPPKHMSYYHDSNILRLFSSKELNQKKYYNNFGEWIDNLNLTRIFDGIVPVCYDSSFAITSKDLLENLDFYNSVFKTMQSEYESHQNIEHVEFMVREK